jgi:phosphatidyl-myo-inositol dimannoside synthase
VIEDEASTPRVLVLATDPEGVGGIERVTRTLLHACSDLYGPERVGLIAVWRRDGLESVPCCVLFAGLPAPESAATGVSLRARVRFAVAAFRAARRWRRRLVVMAAHPHLAPVAWACRLVAGAPYAVWCHGHESWGRLRSSVRFALRRADLIIAPSAFSAEATEKAASLSSGRIVVVPHCLPTHVVVAPRRGPRGPRVLTVSRLESRHAYKGIDTLIYAFPMIRACVPKAELVVVGDGPDLPRLRAAARALGLDGTVSFLGRASDEELAQHYASAAVFALPGRVSLGPNPGGEGFGLVLSEAQAAGVPVVAGAAGPAPEVVENGVSGILVDTSDPRAVADAISGLLLDPERAVAMGKAGANRVAEHFSYERFRRDIDQLLRGIARELTPQQEPST